MRPAEGEDTTGLLPLAVVGLSGEYFGVELAVFGILLTGMGCDGAKGLLAISQAGGIAIAQDEPSSVVFGMPKAAIELGAAKYVIPPEDIAELLTQL
ncbi:MAG TPA: chemotaxis protein CheB [Candidatus Wunengus sp. YC60]|uniref:chemotaxis protein CheB n=1 Tax=Candidatus Wunengus sp. YC60 TaxID=3367697 RepID=UPI00402651D6